MRLAFTTLGCPDWDLATICAHGSRSGYDAVDFRGYLDDVDITQRPEFTDGAAATRRMLDEAGLAVSCISSSIGICDAESREDNIAEAQRTMDVALALGAPFIRLFGRGDVTRGHAAAAEIGVDCLGAILALDGASRFRWLLETHDHWTQARDCRRIVDHFEADRVGVIWDMGTLEPGEPHAETYRQLRDRTAYVHVKDARRATGSDDGEHGGWQLVQPGTGDLPIAANLRMLRQDGYNGYVMFEHEKRWHPELDDPAVALPAFAQWARRVISEAGE